MKAIYIVFGTQSCHSLFLYNVEFDPIFFLFIKLLDLQRMINDNVECAINVFWWLFKRSFV